MSGIHIGLQRILDFMRLGNNFASEEQSMSLDSFAVPLAKKGLLNKLLLLFAFFAFHFFSFFNYLFYTIFLNLIIMKRRENT